MEFILQFISIFLLVGLFFYLKQAIHSLKTSLEQQINEALFNRMESMFEKQLKANDTQLQQLSMNMEKEFAQNWHNLADKTIAETEARIEESTKQLMDRFAHAVKQEEEQISDWITAATQERDLPRKIELIESAMNKYPFKREFMDLYIECIVPLTESNNQIIRKRSIERYNRVARVFLDNCQAQDYLFARDVMNKVLTLGNQFVNEVEQKREADLIETIEKLESYLPKLKVRSLSESELQELETLDKRVDKEALNRYEPLKKRYTTISQHLISNFTVMGQDEEAKKAYNFLALQKIQEAHTLFQQNEKSAKQGYQLEQIVQLLGGWDQNDLFLATQVYYQSVYSDIFAKLDAGVKPMFTKKMLQVVTRKVG